MTRDEMIEALASASAGERNAYGLAAFRQYAKRWMGVVEAAGLKLVPAGYVVIDPEAPLPADAIEAADRAAVIHDEYGENLYIENTEDVIRAYIRRLAEKQR